ncbi:LPS assembly protein LptD [Rhodobacterales bacterium HKCCE2091]|nr:LPS assembly protein LptD [Rhodobacterales bacterium HKCCE2091]
MFRRLLLCLALALAAAPAAAQEREPVPATLIADAIRFDGPSETIVASGTVEVFYGPWTLRAASIRYSGQDERLTVEGPLTLVDESGRAVFLAEFAELDADMQNGVLRSARMVLDRELQIASTEIERIDGRYTQAYQTVASSCEVCAANPRPLWEIRARRIIHDSEEQMLWFENAQFRALGVPIAWFPRLRLPDPTRRRVSGLLVPEVFGNDNIGTGLSLPYFVTLGDHRDLTFAPYATTDGFGGLGLRYREAYRRGWIEATGQLSFDDLTGDEMRGYVFGDGFFYLPRDFVLDLQLQGVTDRAYISTYGIDELDRLESYAIASRTRRDEYVELGFTSYNSLREGDDNRVLPNDILDAIWTRRYDLAGGIAELSFTGHAHYRADGNDITGRDVARIGAEAGWRRDWVLPGGLLVAAETEVFADVYAVAQDSTFPTNEARVSPFAAIELSWPFIRVSPRGVTHMIAPTAQLAWSDDGGANVPNEDSAIVSFDQGNLFALNRFPGSDARETGGRLAFGISYTRTDPLGWSLGTTVGRIWRDEDAMQFTAGSGLDGTRSDWLWALNLTLGSDFSLMNRAVFDDGFTFTSNEIALLWTGDRHDLESSVTFLSADAAEGRPEDTAEFYLAGGYDFGRGWSGEAAWRYDFAADETTRGALGIGYETECIDVEFSLSRRFTSSATVAPATEFGLTVALNGFGANRSGRSQNRVCHN